MADPAENTSIDNIAYKCHFVNCFAKGDVPRNPYPLTTIHPTIPAATHAAASRPIRSAQSGGRR